MISNTNSYILVKNSKGENVHEHRLVGEQIVGRPLEKGEVVHHIDRDKSNNNPSNIMVFKSDADHARHHKISLKNQELVGLDDGSYICISKVIPKTKKHPDSEPGNCLVCGKQIIRNIYCSRKCFGYSRNKQQERAEKHLSGSFLWKRVWSQSTVSLGKDLDVSGNAIRKWCVKEGIPLPPRGYWRKVEVGILEEDLSCPLPTIP